MVAKKKPRWRREPLSRSISKDIPLRDHAEDAMVAVRDAFDAARRKLEDHAREQRGDVKHHEK